MYETIIYEKKDRVATIALNGPKRLNAFNQQLHPEILDAINGSADDDGFSNGAGFS